MNYKKTKYACFITSLSTAIPANLSPLLFLIFKNTYGLSYSLLGLLVVVNFTSQLLIDLIFSFFSHRFHLAVSVKLTPVFMTVGLILYGLTPFLFPNAIYVGLTLGTIIFSVAGGLAEVLTGPIVAALPSDDSDRLLSRLHSCYAWGVVFTVALATLFLYFVGSDRWMYLSFLFAIVPLISFILFIKAPIPSLPTQQKAKNAAGLFANKDLVLCVVCIFLGGASECAMSQWCSGYLEQAFGIEKLWGDLFGVALFGAMLGLGRTLYGKFGKNILHILLISACGTVVCYICAFSFASPIVGVIACALTGLCTAMLWPGSLMVVQERIPNGGVTLFALMAAGGDLGASLIPQLVGIVADAVVASPSASAFASSLSLTVDQLAMKTGLACATVCPLILIVIFLCLIVSGKKSNPRKIG